jgi:hypothetical protein
LTLFDAQHFLDPKDDDDDADLDHLDTETKKKPERIEKEAIFEIFEQFEAQMQTISSLTRRDAMNNPHFRRINYFVICKKMLLQDDSLEVYLFQTDKIQSLQSLQSEQILQNSRSLALDATPAFVLAAGRAVQGMLASGVAEYLEFKSLEGLHWLQDGKLSRVPCSKGDVFGTKLLAPMDKRRLMKFMQLSMDYGTSIALQEEFPKEQAAIDAPEQEVQSLNERHLNQGRSLARPQNKAVSTQELQVLEQCIEEGMSYETYLREKQRLSPRLISTPWPWRRKNQVHL